MAEVIKKFFRWEASTSIDVVAAIIYVSDPGGTVDMNSQKWRFDKGTPQFDNRVVTIPDDLPGFPQVEDTYEMAAQAVDDVGNLADMAVVSAPFDFDAPAPFTGLTISDS
jgi:hypothetical protein